MSRLTVPVISAVLGLLCLTALDDITTGTEPDTLLEWAAVAVAAAWFGGLTLRLRHRS